MDPGLLLYMIVGERGRKGAASVRFHNAVVHLQHTVHTTVCDASALVCCGGLPCSHPGLLFGGKREKSVPKNTFQRRPHFSTCASSPRFAALKALRPLLFVA